MTPTEQTYVTAAHADTCIDIPFWTLWPDMQDLLYQSAQLTFQERRENVEDYDLEGSTLRVALLPISKYVAQMRRDMEMGNLEWDERGPRHVRQFIPVLRNGEYVPPIIVREEGWLDGRHRMFAATKIGIAELPGLDYDEWLNSLVKKHKP
jgi:hypothetical protein